MPYDPNSGQYVPLTDSQKRQAEETAFNVLNNNPNLTNNEVGSKIAQQFYIDDYDALVIYNIIGLARQQVAAGRVIEQDPTAPPDPTIIPDVPGDPGDVGQWIYDTVIIIRDPITGEQSTDRIEYTSEDLVSMDDILADIEGNISDYWTAASPAPPSGVSPQNSDINVIIIGVRHST